MSFWDLFKPKKKKKVSESEKQKWIKQAEKAKKSTKENAKTKKASYRSTQAKQKSQSTPKSTTSSRHGSYVSTATQQKAQTQSTKIQKAHKAYTERVKKERAQQNKTAVKKLEQYTGHKYKNNEEIKGTIYTGDPEQNREYSIAANAKDQNSDKTVYDKKSGQSKGVTIKEYYNQDEHKKEAQKQKAQDEKFINEHPFWAGFGSSFTDTVGRGVEDLKDIYADVKGKDGKKGLDTKKYDKSTAAKVGNMAGLAAQYITPSGLVGKVVGKTAIKTATKATTKALAKSGTKRLAKSGVKQLAKTEAKKTAKEKAKQFAKRRAAEVAADMPLDVIHAKHDSKGDTKEFVKEMRNNLLLNIGVGSGMEYGGKALKALKNKAVAKSAVKKATKNRKETAKAVKNALESLDNRAKEQGDYLSDLRNKMGVKTKEAPTQKPVKGKTVKKAKAETELTIENIRTGKKITGRPRNKQEAQMMLRVASRGAKSTDDIRTSTREVGSPQATHRQPTSNSQASGEQPTVSKSQADVQGKRTELGKLKEQSNEVARDVEELGKKYQNNPAEMMNDPEYGRLMRKHDDIEERINDLSEEVEQPKTGNHEQATNKASGETVETPTIKESIDNTAPRKASENNEVPTGETAVPKTDIDEQLRKLDNAKAKQADDLTNLQRQAGTYKTGRNVLGKLDEANTKQAKELTESRKITGFSNKATTRRAIKQGEAIRASERAEQPIEPVPETPKQKSSIEYKRDLRDLEKRRGTMSARKYEAEKADIEAKRAEAKAREEVEAQKVKDRKDAQRIMRKPAKERTPDEVRKIVEDKENAPVARINTKIERAKTTYDKVYFRKVKTNLQRLFTDSGSAFENMAREAMRHGKKAEGEALDSAVNSLRQTEKSVQYQIIDAQTDFNYHRIGDSAYDITTPLKKQGKKIGKPMFEDTQELLYHMHNVQRVKNGKPVFGEKVNGVMSQKRIEEIRKKYSAKELELIDGQIEKVHEYFNNLRKLRVESGLISKELDDYLAELYPNYIPTKRSGEFGNAGRGEFDTKTAKGEEGTHGVVGAPDGKEAVGSERDLLSLEDQMVRATSEVWSASKTNNLVQKVMELQGFKGKTLKASDMPKNADGSQKTFEDIISDSMFAEGSKEGGYRLRWFDEGKPMTAECTEEVYQALKSLNGQGLNLPEYMSKALDMTTGNANSIFKKLCTEWNPFFALYRNPMRDIQDAWMYSKDFKSFITHMPAAIKRMSKRDEYWQLWKASGGTQSSLFDITSQIKKSKNPLRRLGLVNSAVEQFPRFTEFCSILDKELNGAPVSSATREMIDKASQAGADITVNFGRSGDVTKLVNRYAVPFLNPGVQGISKGVRLITERSGAKAFVALAAKAAALGFTPAVINEALLHDNKEYQQMNARDKLTNYIFHIGDNYIKIPKGRLLSLIGMAGMKATNKFTGGDDYTFEEMRDVAINQSAPANPLSDNLAMTAYHALNNKTWYGGNIQSDFDEDEQKAQWRIYDADTTSLAKKLAKTDFFKSIENEEGVVGVSPKKIDAMLKGYSGVLGELAMPLMTQKSKGAGLTGTLGNLAKKTFTIDPRYQNSFSTDFYDKVNETARKANDTGKAKDKAQSKYYSDQSKRVSAINDVIKDVQNSDRSYEEKNKMVDALTDRRNKLMDNALKGVKMADDYKMRDMDAVADVVGKSAALDYSVGNKTDKEARKACGNDEEFYKGYRAIQGMGASSKTAKSVALVSAGADKKVYEAYGIKDDYRQRAKDYFKNGGSTEEFTKANEITAGSGNDYMLKAMKLAKAKAPDRVYAVNDIYQSKMVAARVLSKAGYKDDFFASKNLKPKIDTDGSGRYSKDEVYNFVSKQKASTNVKNALWSAIAYKNMKPMFGSPTVPKENYKLKGASGSPKGSSTQAKRDKNLTPLHKDYWKTSGKTSQVDYSNPMSKEFMDNFGANMDKERRRVGEKLYRAAQSSVRGINAPYKNDKDYLPKETLQVVRSGDERLDAEALKALKSGGIKALVKQAQKNLPKIKEPNDNTTFDDDGSSGGGGGYRRYGRRGYGRGGSGSGGGGGSTKTTAVKPSEIKTQDAKYNGDTWNPTEVSTKAGWTNAQIRRVFNALISRGLSQQQAISAINSLWNTRFNG